MAATIAARVRELKEHEEDFEWYPTTTEILDKVSTELTVILEGHWRRSDRSLRILDIGAGDGRALQALAAAAEAADTSCKVECYAIEKAVVHLRNMPKTITVIGTEFEQQTLIDKPMTAVFCNPPYSEYVEWTCKILQEARAEVIFLVIPARWKKSPQIEQCLSQRKIDVDSLGRFDFENADRRARAEVEIVLLRSNDSEDRQFNSVFEKMMPELDVFDVPLEDEPPVRVEHDLISTSGKDLVTLMVEAYDKALASMLENYRAALKLDARVLSELGIDKPNMLNAIRLKVKSLKTKYWKALFDEAETVTQRLCTKQRSRFLDSLENKMIIDFTCNNVYAMLIWISKWSNDYFDEQLIDLFRCMTSKSNVVKYKSNQRVWTEVDWRYRHYGEEDIRRTPTHYRLEYRIVLDNVGGISKSTWAFEKEAFSGLTEPACNLLRDICTVANNLGFPCKDNPRNFKWASNKQHILRMTDGTPVVAVRAFLNGNLHLHFNPKVMLAINVEAGRLLRWIRNPAEACDELQVEKKEVAQVEELFDSMYRIGSDSGFLRLENMESDNA
jgi:hypothetical protein